jgi:energy-coupling factor transporter ATP-binding protein EcfA2
MVAATKEGNGPRIILEGADMKFENVSVHKPDGTLLVKDLNIEVKKGQRVLVTGSNGCGKSSLFRIMKHLWPLVCGTITMPREDLYFLSQKNFVPIGTLRDLVTYPLSKAEHEAAGRTDEEVMECLDMAFVSPVPGQVKKGNRVKIRDDLLKLRHNDDTQVLTFEEVDTNHDGVIDRDEFNAMRKAQVYAGKSGVVQELKAVNTPDCTILVSFDKMEDHWFSPRELEESAELEFTEAGKIVRPKLDDERDWVKDLSPGQQQKIGFARLFYHRPQFVVLDECTNGTSPDVEESVYRRCMAENMTIFSISHTVDLKKYHHFELHLEGVGGAYKFLPTEKTMGKYRF